MRDDRGAGGKPTRALFFAAVFLATATAQASTKVTVTAPKGFDKGIETVIVATVECAPEADCPDIESRTTAALKKVRPDLKIVLATFVRNALFEMGKTEYGEDLREILATKLKADAVLEIRVPFAKRGDGYGGRRGSESKVDVRLVKPTGEILMSGVGFGRPMNVVTSPERVAGNTIEAVLKKAFR